MVEDDNEQTETESMAHRALIIDDDKLALDLLTFHLTSDGFKVDTAESGGKGLDLAKSNEYDVVLTDLNLPDINGIEMVRESKGISPTTEIIVVTGEDSAEKAIEATRMGAFGYIVKDGNYQGLMVDVRNAVERKKQTLINSQQAREIEELRGRLSSRTSYEGVIGGARSMQNIYEIIENVASFSAISKVRLPERIATRSASSARPRAAVCCWMRSVRCRSICSRNCFASCRKRSFTASAATSRRRPISG
jgi:DNA-binding NtrC family response regulator